MRLRNKRNLIFSLIAMVAFAIIALVYNAPVISGSKALLQPDIVNFRGSAEEMLHYQEQTGENVYWSDAMFGGMPTYQTGASYSNYWIKGVDQLFRFLPRPADYIFILLGGFFILGIVLLKNWKYAVLGALLFGLGTYFFIVIEAGHNSKVHAIAYFAPLMAGIILLYRQKYIQGFLLTTLFMALELVANHPQMTYYFGFVVLLYIIFELVEAVQQKQLRDFMKSSALSLGAVVLALGLNATSYIATYEYSQSSTRGKNDVTLLQTKNTNTKGLDKDYITNWSYGKLETLNLFIPNAMGGGSNGTDEFKENLRNSITEGAKGIAHQYAQQDPAMSYEDIYPQVVQSLKANLSAIPTYWGEQPFTSGPAYQGAVVLFLFILGLFLVKGKYKWWLLSATVLSILLAWGKNMMWLTDFFIDYIPLYDKFRAVSSILVIAEFTMPLLAVLAVFTFFRDKTLDPVYRKKALYYVGGGVLLFLAILYFIGGSVLDFTSPIDAQIPDFMQRAIKEDRIAMFKSDTLRTFILVALSWGLLVLFQIKVLKRREWVIAGLGVLTLVDLWGVDKRYLNQENFVPAQWVEHPFPTEVSQRMMQEAQSNPSIMQIAYRVPSNKLLSDLKKNDPGHYRVYNTTTSTFQDAATSYFVNSIGGYHGAKLRSVQNIIDVYFSMDSVQSKRLGVSLRGKENILHLLNTKYVVTGSVQNPQIMSNPMANGDAWFVSKVKKAPTANDAIIEISQLNTAEEAVVEKADIGEVSKDSAQIKLTHYLPNKLTYHTENSKHGFAVFSEMYYQDGWEAKIDGKKAPIVKTNYFLRGLEIPQGKHEVVFEFKPQLIDTGYDIMLGSNLLFLLMSLIGVFKLLKRSKILYKR